MEEDFADTKKTASYSAFLHRPMTTPPQEIYEALGKGPIEPSLALSVHNLNDLLNPGYHSCEIGYCLMSDGTGYVAMLTQMPGVTMEMVDWWFVWQGLEDERYKIWCQDDHLGTHVRPEDLARRLDTSLSMKERSWNTTDVAYEDIGTGPVLLDISFMSPEDYGYDMTRFKAPNTVGAICANACLSEVRKPITTVTHFFREIPGGIELRSRYWLGWQIQGKQPVIVEKNVPLELVKGVAFHCTKEFTNLAAILPSVYAENAHIIDKIEDFKPLS